MSSSKKQCALFVKIFFDLIKKHELHRHYKNQHLTKIEVKMKPMLGFELWENM